MFREYVDLVNESVKRGIDQGVQTFLESLNDDIEMDEICESNEGIGNVLAKVFTENGFSVTALEQETTEVIDEDFDARLDKVLEQLKVEGIVD